MKNLKLFLVLAVIMLASTSVRAQDSFTAFETNKILIADETWAKENSKTVSIITTNESIKDEIVRKYKNFIRMSMTKKHDRKGYYYQYTFVYSKEDYRLITIASNTHGKKE